VAAVAATAPTTVAPPAATGGRPPARPRRGRWPAAVAVTVALAAAGWLAMRPAHEQVPLSSLAPPVAEKDISAPVDAGGAPDTLLAAAAGDSSARPSAGPGDSPARSPAVVDSAVAVAVDAPVPALPAPADTAGRSAPPTAAGFDAAPYRLPVGRDGWTLHVYSQPDSVLAQRQAATLARSGFTTAWRAVELPGKGRWYRIYMGSFPSRAAAEAALPALLRRLGESWGQATRY
ncbi:MAG: SPOR domain-containing protein, partial [Candidatus Krumholzibacteriia bacterium]